MLCDVTAPTDLTAAIAAIEPADPAATIPVQIRPCSDMPAVSQATDEFLRPRRSTLA